MRTPSARGVLMTLGLFLTLGAVAMLGWGFMAVQVCVLFNIEVLGEAPRPCPDWSGAVALAVLTAGVLTGLTLVAHFTRRRLRERRGVQSG